MSRVERRL